MTIGAVLMVACWELLGKWEGMVITMSVKVVNTKSAVMFEAVKRNKVDRLCSIAIVVCVRFDHKFVFVYEPASGESESTWYPMDYSDFDVVRDICSIAFETIAIDASMPDIDGYNTYRIYGIESVE